MILAKEVQSLLYLARFTFFRTPIKGDPPYNTFGRGCMHSKSRVKNYTSLRVSIIATLCTLCDILMDAVQGTLLWFNISQWQVKVNYIML